MKKIDYDTGNPETTLAERLRGFRLRAGFSQQNVADILNVSRSTYTYYETGKTSPDPTTLNRIAKIFDVPLEDFFPEENNNQIVRDPKIRRSPKKVLADPRRIGELSSGEKTLVAFLRDSRLPPETAIEHLKRLCQQADDERKLI